MPVRRRTIHHPAAVASLDRVRHRHSPNGGVPAQPDNASRVRLDVLAKDPAAGDGRGELGRRFHPLSRDGPGCRGHLLARPRPIRRRRVKIPLSALCMYTARRR